MSGEHLAANGDERLARLVAKYRARRARRLARSEPPAETLDQFGQRVFGDEVGEQVLIDWLREHAPWVLAETEHEIPVADGR